MGLTKGSSAVVTRRDVPAYAEREADRMVVWLKGEHDASTVDALWETLDRAIAFDDADLVIDLSEVEFMGSATVGVIVRARESLRPRSRSLTLRSPSRCARRLLDLYGLADRLDPYAAGVSSAPWAESGTTSVAGRESP